MSMGTQTLPATDLHTWMRTGITYTTNTCFGVDTERALQKVVHTFCNVGIQPRVTPLQHDLISRGLLQ